MAAVALSQRRLRFSGKSLA
jgi:excisionase family DNA binding protein